MSKLITILAAVALLGTAANAAMIIGAIGNDGSGNFDGSITATAHDEFNNRTPAEAVEGDGIIVPAPPDDQDRTLYSHDSGSDGFGQNLNWLGDRTTGGSIGWFKVDLGASYRLDEAFLFNFNPNNLGRSSRGINSTNIYHATTDPENNADLNNTAFDNTGWTLLRNQSFTRVSGANDPQATPDVIDFNGISARFVALEIITNHGDGSFVGFGEIQFFEIPEPTTAALLGLASLGLLRRRRV